MWGTWQILIGLPLAVLICILLLPGAAEGSYILLEDDFTGADGSSPDSFKWVTETWDSNDYVEIESNAVRTHTVDGAYARVSNKEVFRTDNFSLELDMKPISFSGAILQISVLSMEGDVYREMMILSYLSANGWEYLARKNGDLVRTTSYVKNLQANSWYSLNLTFRSNSFTAVVTPQGSSTVLWSSGTVTMDALTQGNIIRFGCYTGVLSDPSAAWDNYRLIDHNLPPQPPVWGELPTLEAVEDVHLVYDFTDNVSDPDSPLVDLLIEGDSPYIVDQDGLELIFLFPNGVMDASILMNLSDGQYTVGKVVSFTVEPVNDPPSYDGPVEFVAREDEPRTIDLTPHVSDIDNATVDLFVWTEDMYASTEGLLLTMTFPEGVTEHEMSIDVTDGLLSTVVRFSFAIVPVNDPPVLDLPKILNVTEDVAYPLNLAPMIVDEDSPSEWLYVIVEDEHVKVERLVLTFLYPTEVDDHEIELEVSDGQAAVLGTITIHVVPVNDAPVIDPLGPLEFVEEVETTVELASYIHDEDHADSELVLTLNHPSLVDITGLSVTMLYDAHEPSHIIELSVSDGIHTVFANVSVHISPVDDAPRIVGIGDLVQPYNLKVNEGAEMFLDVEVEDEDDTFITFHVFSDMGWIEMLSRGILWVHPRMGDVGNFTATVIVQDSWGVEDSAEVSIEVLNINDPPSVPEIISPMNHTVVEEGADVRFAVSVDDPDLALGQKLTVTWTSNISGELVEIRGTDDFAFTLMNLSEGDHRITVMASDGEFESQAWFGITIVKPYTEPEDEDESFYTSTSGLFLIVMVVLLVILAVVNYVLYVKRKPMDPEDGPGQGHA